MHCKMCLKNSIRFLNLGIYSCLFVALLRVEEELKALFCYTLILELEECSVVNGNLTFWGKPPGGVELGSFGNKCFHCHRGILMQYTNFGCYFDKLRGNFCTR